MPAWLQYDGQGHDAVDERSVLWQNALQDGLPFDDGVGIPSAVEPNRKAAAVGTGAEVLSAASGAADLRREGGMGGSRQVERHAGTRKGMMHAGARTSGKESQAGVQSTPSPATRPRPPPRPPATHKGPRTELVM